MAETQDRHAPLTPQQRKFAQEFVARGRAAEAAKAAGYAPRSAGETASRLLKRPTMRAYVDALLGRMIDYDAARVAERLAAADREDLK